MKADRQMLPLDRLATVHRVTEGTLQFRACQCSTDAIRQNGQLIKTRINRYRAFEQVDEGQAAKQSRHNPYSRNIAWQTGKGSIVIHE